MPGQPAGQPPAGVVVAHIGQHAQLIQVTLTQLDRQLIPEPAELVTMDLSYLATVSGGGPRSSCHYRRRPSSTSRRPWRAPTGPSPASPRDGGPRRGVRPGWPITSPPGRSSAGWKRLLFVAGLVVMVWGIRDTARTPGHWVNYVQVAWSFFLVACPISQYVRSGARMTGLVVISSGLAGEVIYIWNAVQAPGDWVNYFVAAWFFLLNVAWWLIRRWVRTGGHDAGRAGKVAA